MSFTSFYNDEMISLITPSAKDKGIRYSCLSITPLSHIIFGEGYRLTCLAFCMWYSQVMNIGNSTISLFEILEYIDGKQIQVTN